MTFGPHAEAIARAADAAGAPIPDDALPPELDALATEAYGAFQAISGDRPAGFGGLGPIPFSAIDRWAERYRVAGEDFERLVRLIRAADGAFLAELERKRPKGNRQKGHGRLPAAGSAAR